MFTDIPLGGIYIVRKVIARVKLNPGQGGYFDPISRIHLTHGDPEKDIYSDMNTSGIKAAVRNKRISLVSGSLGDISPAFKLVRRPDGKVALIANNQEKVVETSAPETIKPKKVENVLKTREEYKKPVEPVKAATEEVEVKTPPELPAVDPPEDIRQTPIIQGPVEDTVKKEKKNPFNKKKNNKKSEDTTEDSEQKTE